MRNVQSQLLGSSVAIPSHILESVKFTGHTRQRQPIEQDFNSYYDEHIEQPVAETLAEHKKKIPFARILSRTFITALTMGALWFGWKFWTVWSSYTPDDAAYGGLVAIQSLLFTFGLPILFYLTRNKIFPSRMKNMRNAQSAKLGAIIVPEIFRYLDNGCTFSRNSSLNENDLDFLGIAPHKGVFGSTSTPYRYHCHDEVVGTRNGLAFKMMEIKIEIEVRQHKMGKRHYRTIFNGVYLLVDVPKPFTCRVDISQEYKKIQSAIINRSFGMKRVRLEDPEFERQFQVYSDDQIEARQLLTTTMMQNLNNLRFLLGGKSLDARFCHRKLALRIDCPHDLFEIKSGLAAEEYRNQAKKIIGDLNSIFKTIDAMDLNTQRII